MHIGTFYAGTPIVRACQLSTSASCCLALGLPSCQQLQQAPELSCVIACCRNVLYSLHCHRAVCQCREPWAVCQFVRCLPMRVKLACVASPGVKGVGVPARDPTMPIPKPWAVVPHTVLVRPMLGLMTDCLQVMSLGSTVVRCWVAWPCSIGIVAILCHCS